MELPSGHLQEMAAFIRRPLEHEGHDGWLRRNPQLLNAWYPLGGETHYLRYWLGRAEVLSLDTKDVLAGIKRGLGVAWDAGAGWQQGRGLQRWSSPPHRGLATRPLELRPMRMPLRLGRAGMPTGADELHAECTWRGRLGLQLYGAMVTGEALHARGSQ